MPRCLRATGTGRARPRTRTLSCLRGRSFSDCVHLLTGDRKQLQHESWHPQYLWMVGTDAGKLISKVDQVLARENLAEDFIKLCTLWDISCDPLP